MEHFLLITSHKPGCQYVLRTHLDLEIHNLINVLRPAPWLLNMQTHKVENVRQVAQIVPTTLTKQLKLVS